MNEILDAIKKSLADTASVPSSAISKRWNIDVPTYDILSDKISITDSYTVDHEHQVVLLTVADDSNISNYLVTYGYDDTLSYTSLEEVGFDFAHFLYIVKEQKIQCNRKVATDAFLAEYLFTGEDLEIAQVKEYLPKCYASVCSYLINEQLPASSLERQQFIIKILFEHELQTLSLSVLYFDNDTIRAYDKVLSND